MTRLEALVAEFEQVGCSYRDWNFEYGLVDFPAMIDGHRVQLCWRSDEPSILFYHGVNEGYAGRMAIPEDYREDTGRVTGAAKPVK